MLRCVFVPIFYLLFLFSPCFSTSAPAGPQTFRRRIEHEFSRQLQFYTHTTSALQAKLSQAEAAIASSNERRISENIHVMRQVNDLRHRNLEYKNEVMQVNSDLNAIKLRERIRRLAKNGPAAGGGAGGAGAGIHREPLHTPRNPVLSATKHTARFLARYVDEDMGVDGLVSGVEPGESGARALVDPALTRAFDRQVVHKHAGPATPVDLSQGRRAHRHDEGDDGSGGGEGQEEEGQGPDTPSNRALLHEQVSLVKQMKEESEHMLLNSYRRINEQDQEIAMLRQENEKLMMVRVRTRCAALMVWRGVGSSDAATRPLFSLVGTCLVSALFLFFSSACRCSTWLMANSRRLPPPPPLA